MSLNDFPEELIELTLSFIKSHKKRRIARAVCKKWLQYSGIVYFDIDMPLRHEIQSIRETFSRCAQLFSLKIRKADKFKYEDYNELFYNLTHMISLEISLLQKPWIAANESGMIKLDQLTNLQRLVVPDINVSIGSVILPYLTHLEVSNVIFTNPNSLPNLEYFSLNHNEADSTVYPTIPKLSEFRYKSNQIGDHDFVQNLRALHLPRIKQFKDIPFQNLEDLRVEDISDIERCEKLTKLAVAELRTGSPIQSATNLRDLTLGSATRFPENSLSFLENMKQLNSFRWLTYNPDTSRNGEFLNYLNPDTLTRLTFEICANEVHNRITLFTNLQRLNICTEYEPDLESLSNLSKLTKLVVSADYCRVNMHWVTSLTSLQHLELTYTDEDEQLDLNNLTNLTSLQIDPENSIRPLPNLTKLRNLHIEAAQGYTFLSNLTKLTSLHISHSTIAPIDQVTKLRKLRKLTLNLSSNEQLAALTALQKLTELFVWNRSKVVQPDTLTLLTRLQTVGMSMQSAQHWSPKHSPDIAQKLPYAVWFA